MTKERHFTLETRLEKDEIQYFIDYISVFCKMYREVWNDRVHGNLLNGTYKSDMCSKHNVMSRTMNSIIKDVKGRYTALQELQKQQIKDLGHKIDVFDAEIKKLKSALSGHRDLARENKLNENELVKYRNMKSRLFGLQCRKDRYVNKIKCMKTSTKMCFGTKQFWGKQYHIEENGFKSYECWLNQFRKKRDSYIYYVGSSDETCGNRMFQLTYDESLDCFHCKIRKEKAYSSEKDKYLYLDVNFKSSRRDNLIEFLKNRKKVSLRVLRRNNKWYLQVIFSVDFDIITDKHNGCVGVDFNNGFLAVSETDMCGNLVNTDTFLLKYHGGGNRASTEMQKIVKDLVVYCKQKHKALVIEDLSFGKKKSGTLHKKNKWYNRMIHMLDYSRFSELCSNSTAVYGVEFIKVSPFNTTKIAKSKYCKQRKLNGHIGASYVAARRGQGFKDKLA